ncbi:UvrD-helicase domain-containing protein [Crenobacter intestini]|uniref:UvrD-helicase domain-containing protein n=1 Tax=Crenobacter intestini TaxID=2563443 RepID=UPI0014581569|nr:ATP-dependent helicase [Crenobacter intestini]
MAEVSPDFSPSPEQQAVLDFAGGHLLVEAAAGSGKTTLLALAAARAVRAGQRVRALTFSRSGKASLEAALARHGVTGVAVQTFDEVCVAEAARLLVDDARRVQRDWVVETVLPEVVGRVNEANAGSDAVQLPTDTASLIDLIDSFRLIRQGRLSDLLEDADEEEVAATLGRPASVWQAWREYERLRRILRVDGGFGFRLVEDACHDLMAGFEENALAAAPTLACDVLLIDEFHDTSALQLAWLAAWGGGVQRVLAVGDRDQVLYAWRGADATSVFLLFRQAFAPVAVLPLTVSFRFGAGLARQLAPLRSRGLPPLSGAGGPTSVDVSREPLPALAATLEGGAALICRDRAATVAVQLALIDARRPFYTLDGWPCWRGGEGTLIQALAQLAAPDWRAHSAQADARKAGYERQRRERLAQRLASLPALALSADEGREFAALAAETGDWPQLVALIDALPAPEDARRAHAQGSLKAALTRLTSASSDARLAPLLTDFARDTHLEATLAAFAPAGEAAMSRVDAWRALLAHLAQHGETAASWLARCEALNLAHWRAQQSPGQHLAVGSVFHAKGRQWPHVVVCQLSHGLFPLAGAPLADEKRRAYVAFTRAQQRLTLHAPAGAEPSSFFTLFTPTDR